MAQTPEIILYHYSFSPYARRIVWYLNLRKIPYTQCPQPPTLPRPDVRSIGTHYRRIPLAAIGRDIYLDTRLILRKLHVLFPPSAAHPALSSASPAAQALERLLEHWAVDNGLFNKAAALIPSDMPLLRDPKFTKDREDYTGRSWAKENVDRGRPEALVGVRSAFEFAEKGLLGDGRQWVGGGDAPDMCDIEAVWPLHWLTTLKGALPPTLISAQKYPKTFAWIDRFEKVTKAAAKEAGKPKTVKGPDALKLIGSAEFAEGEGEVDGEDPSGLKQGTVVEVWPIDTGFNHKDQGKLLALNGDEIVIESKTDEGKVVRVHAPRHGFRLRAVKEGKAKL